MNSKMCDIVEVEGLLKQGKSLLVAGDENVLKKLPKGNWIGGTIPYFMANEGGIITDKKVFVTVLPDYIHGTEVKIYDEQSISNVYIDAPQNGFSLIILPATSPVHLSFALNAPKFKNFATRPLVGWVSGIHLNDLGKITPKVFNGKTGEVSDQKAVVMQIHLPTDWVCDIGIVNIFTQGDGDTIEFLKTDFTASEVLVNGKKTKLTNYLKEKNIDTKLPLVANYAGENINVAFQEVNNESGKVSFYAPVFEGVKYKLAKPIQNYIQDFTKSMPQEKNVLFSCNCILNFLYSELEGKKTGNSTGPITFGEIAYQLLTQTMVYLTIDKID